jgi:hypothetical protein
MRRRTSLRERGQVLVLAAFGMAAMMGFVGLAVDGGLYMVNRRELQNSSDAASLAAVAHLPGDADAAHAAALAWAANNGMDPEDIEGVTDCDDGYLDDADTCVRVKVRRDSPSIFFRVLGVLDAEVTAKAAAQTGSLVGVTGLTPFGVLEEAVNECDLPPPIECLVTLKYDVQDVGANIGDLDFDGQGGGGADLEDKIKGGNVGPLCSINEDPIVVGCETTEPAKPGNTVGKIRPAMNWRLNETTGECDTIGEVFQDTDSDGTIEIVAGCNPWGGAVQGDTDGDGGSCDNILWHDDEGNASERGSCRVIAVPVVNELTPPNEPMTNLGFALFWVDTLGHCSGNDCEINGYFIDAEVSVGGLLGAYNPDNTPFRVSKLVE